MTDEFVRCLICRDEMKSVRALATHLQHKHKMRSIDYAVEYIYDGRQPSCAECGEDTRYVSFTFKTHCKKHAKLSMSAAGKIGGKIKRTWNKGHTKETLALLKRYSEEFAAEGNPFFGMSHSDTSIEKMKSNSRLSSEEIHSRLKDRMSDWIFKFEPSGYKSRQHQYIYCICRICNKESKRTLQALERGSICHYCYPIDKVSKPEVELRRLIMESGMVAVEHNTRSIIPPQELDIYLPEKKFAIEYNGLYWHSEERKGKKYHLAKTNECREQDIQLFHIFSDEWREKQEIIESMIYQRIGKVDNRVFARKCEIKTVPRDESKEFFNATHISENARSKITFGLYYENELMIALSLRSPFHRVYRERKLIEIARLSSALNTVVVGGFSKLIKAAKQWARDNDYRGILTYADRRFGEGEVYIKSGFELTKVTLPDYWYSDGRLRFNRFKYRAQDGKPEKAVALEAGVFKVYGCGSNVYELSL